MSLDPLLQVFVEEADELLRAYEEGVLGLERAPADRERLHAIFRAAHTLKGNSAMLGFERISTVTHALEELLVRLRAGDAAPGRAVIDTLLAASDVLRVLLARARAGEDADVPGLGALVDALADHAQALGHPGLPAPAADPAPAAEQVHEVHFQPAPDLLRRGVDPLRLLDAVAALGQVLEVRGDLAALPPFDALDPEAAYLGFTCRLRTAAPRAALAECFEFVHEPGTLRIVTEDTGGRSAGGGATAAPVGPGAERPAPRAEGSIRVATDKVDRLVDLVGELVITQSMVAQLAHQLTTGGATPERLAELAEAVAQMDRHARDLEERVMAIRMVPIRTVFGRFSRVVRDLARAEGKRVRLETRGDETELDKTVIERIADPLMHLVRNAVDHGLEPPAERRARGKPETGTVTLAAYQQGGAIYIEVGDDGRGLDRERIVRKAVEAGLVASGDGLSDEAVQALIWEPGFSTAERVTEVSGRGVGMDVVRRNVEALGGIITIASTPGRGATFRVKLPLTLAILDGQTLRVGGQVYVLPLSAITESVRPSGDALRAVFGAGEAFLMRGEVLPFLRLHRLFGVAGAEEDPTRGLAVVVEHDGRRVALLVDELLGQQQFVIKSLDANFHRVDGVSGATILGDGRVALILDVPGLVGLARTLGRAA